VRAASARSPDGRSIAVRDDIDRKLHAVDLATGDVRALTDGDGDDSFPRATVPSRNSTSGTSA
jgi:hypothetical protein